MDVKKPPITATLSSPGAALFKEAAESFSGTLLTDEKSRNLYATDASLYRLVPQAILCPASQNDVIEALNFCRTHHLPLTCRGAGTSTAGQAVGTGLILDFSRHMNALLEVDVEGRTAAIEPGIVYDTLNLQLEKSGLFFPVNPSSGSLCTLGGMLANNASGPYSLKYGATKENVLQLKVLLADGRIIDTTEPPDDLLQPLKKIGARFRRELKEIKPKTAVNSSGYNIWEGLQEERVDLTRLLIGSEGTLGVILSARLQLVPLPKERRAALLGFAELDLCAKAVQMLRPLNPSALELLDRELLAAIRASRPQEAALIPLGLEALLVVEFDSNQQAPLDDCLKQTQTLTRGLYVSFEPLNHPEIFWSLRKSASPLLHRNENGVEPLRFIEDGAVPPESLPEYLRGLRRILQQHGTQGAAFGHAGNGHIHINPRLNPRLPADLARARAIMEAQTQLIVDLNGTVSGEHGDGLLRTAALRKLYGPLVEAFERVKEVFDPHSILNPGKILNADCEAPFRHWRY